MTSLPAAARLTAALSLAGLLLWGALYVQRTSFVHEGERVYCLWDDAMVSMQYARNLARGDGLTWNPGEAVQGYSNPGVTLVMAGLHLLPLSPTKVSLAFQLLNLAILGLCWFLTRRLAALFFDDGWTELAAGIGVVLAGTLSIWTLQGSDVGFVTLWLLACVLWVLREQREVGDWPPGLIVLLAAGLLIRFDVLIFQLVLLGFGVVAGQRATRVAAAAGACVLVGLGLVAFGYFYYGDLLPNTYYLKATGSPRSLVLGSGLSQLAFWWPGALPLVAIAIWAIARCRSAAAWLAAAMCGSATVYHVWVGGDWGGEYGSRFMAPVLPLLCILGAAGCTALGRIRALSGRLTATVRGSAAAAVLAVLAVASTPDAARSEWLDPRTPTMYREDNRENLRYALYVRDHTNPDTTIGVHWAGVPPYFSERPAIDVLGKTDRHIARLVVPLFVPGHSKWDWDYVLHQRKPDILLMATRGLAERSDFAALYYWVQRGNDYFFLRKTSVAKLEDPQAGLIDMTTRRPVVR